MKMSSYKKITLSVIAACGLLISPLSASYAADAAKQNAKPASCKQEARKKGIKDKAEMKKYVAECKKHRKLAKKKSEAGKK
jgi:hypothetical protein